jgi:hypothetical protein
MRKWRYSFTAASILNVDMVKLSLFLIKYQAVKTYREVEV